MLMGLNREVGVQKALEFIDLKFEGTHHRGDDDAFNIAKIFAYISSQVRQR